MKTATMMILALVLTACGGGEDLPTATVAPVNYPVAKVAQVDVPTATVAAVDVVK